MSSGTDTTSDANAVDAARTLKNLSYVGISIAIVALLALLASQLHGLFAAIGIGVLIVLSSGAVGAVLGFLFALPRILSKDPKEEPVGAGGATTGARARFLGSNTNLERVSDWLTTMIIGVGLTQLGQVNSALYDFRVFIADTAKVFPAGCTTACNAGALPLVGPMLLIFGFIGGFIALYLFTRLKISSLFQRVEEDLNRLPSTSAAAVKEAASEASLASGGASESPAIQAVLSSSQPSVDESLSLMYSLLYRPNGYQQVIDLGGRLSNTAATKRPEYWFYLAAAFGQKYSSLKATGASDEELRSARDNALDCARRAVTLDPSFKHRLLHISDPEGSDNDLADLRNDPDFQKIVGVRARKS
jgi:hypothetical protein